MKADDNQAVTKTDLIILEQNIKQDIDENLEKIDEKNKGYRDEILTALDGVAKELETWREDKVLADHQLVDHENRITALESPAH